MALSREDIAMRYGQALFDFAKEKGSLDTVYEELGELRLAIKENPNFITILSDPIVNSAEKRNILDAIIENFSAESKEFLHLLLTYNRYSELLEIIEHFCNLYDEKNLIARGTAITAVKLDEDQLARLGQGFAKRYNLSSVRLENQVDPSILGGVILQVKDLVIDGSVQNRLQKIRTQLMNKE
ncbi:F0F1 ATP synthase subunit delta [Lactobacillus pasteurii DSM 23907 = CRBIP 24.76]|uniref:ATP synthase subunit delta n=1 Tax=Lactobacillus pasteurii DSM 23907 = CRBIP 24.76 TaxID=1423790 RepID=I7LE52_9LACO|nr:F0F1 ATP synthase subunit delta [Lactobacillus pasteurii]KRK08724.1 F0F1 ATP synthase subunit delta [Lactobacillus pasteurii DSM 23907 = CRBIP 24.76]TDG76450.1 hypothetical protein C5L33_001209 [Lactobacillus pasteurii]CCI85458.1 ATP synthase subunit delta [Lactobacillus pasteurii DSM 23907 = CRBIP 24.76]